MRVRRLLSLFVLLGAGVVFPERASAAESHRALTQYLVDSWGTDEGLPHNKVQAISQGPDGFLWLATEGGIARFDGVRFWPFAPQEAPELRIAPAGALHTAKNGAIWIGNSQGQVFRWKDGALTRFRFPEKDSAPVVRAIQEDPTGTIWIGASQKVYRVRDKTLVEELELDGRVHDIQVDPQGGMLIVGAGGVFHLGPEGLVDYTKNTGFPDTTTFAARRCKGDIWAATLDGLGVFREGHWRMLGVKDGLPDSAVADLMIDREGALWVATWGGIARWDGRRFSSFSRRDGLTDEAVYSMFEDRDGSVWIGTRGGGLNRFRVPSVPTYTSFEGLSRNDVVAVLADRQGRVWAANSDAGPDVFVDDRWKPADPLGLLRGQSVEGMAEDSEGAIWFNAWNTLVVFRKGKFEKIPLPPEAEGKIESMVASPQGGLWMYSGNLIYRFNGRVRESFRVDDEQFGGLNWVFGENADGVLWLGTTDGLVRYQEGRCAFEWKAPEPFGSITTFLEGKTGALWLGTDGSGLVRIQRGSATIFNRTHGLPDDWIQQIAEDSAGNLWIGSHGGIFSVAPKDLVTIEDRPAVLHFRLFSTKDGLRSNYCEGSAQPRVTRTADGRLWFTTSQGVSVVDPERLTSGGWTPPPVITGLTVDGQASNGDGLTYPPGRGRVEIHYTVANLSFPTRVRFRYLLEGFDRGWSAPTSQRSVLYENLRPGPYRFRVGVSNGGDTWDESGETISFTLRPHFYQTMPFFATCGLFALAVVLASIHLRTRSLARHAAQLETKVAERTAQLAQERDAARRAASARSEFLANMSHEIRTPLNGVIGMTDIVLESPLPETQRSDLLLARRSAETLLTIINDILDFSKIEAGKLDIESIPFDLRDTIESIAGLLRPAFEQKGLFLKIEYPEDGKTVVQGDPTRVRQIVLNFATNSLKFTDEGGVLIRATRGEDGVHWSISVKDTGVGIPEERQGVLFQQFVQTDSSTARRYGGTGLGLAISKQLAGLMGGSVGLSSAAGEGSTFWVELPLPPATLPVPMPLLAEPVRGPALGGRVLVAEDNHVNQLVVRRMIEKLGCVVDLAANGKEAVAAWGKNTYDMVFMDCDMPEVDGFEATREIRRLEQSGRTPIIALTARAMSGDRDQCLAAGMDDYLPKPVRREELTQIIERWLGVTSPQV